MQYAISIFIIMEIGNIFKVAEEILEWLLLVQYANKLFVIVPGIVDDHFYTIPPGNDLYDFFCFTFSK